MADDLDDEWWLDGSTTDNVEQSDDGTEPKEPVAKKRKLDKKIEEEVEPKKKKQDKLSEVKDKKKKKKKRKKKRDDVAENDVSGPTALQLVEALNSHYDGKISVVEKDEITLTESEHFLPSNGKKDEAAKYLCDILPEWAVTKKEAEKKPGCPVILIICPAAIRAVRLNRLIEGFKGTDCKVAKLFAKHMKLAEQVKFLGKAQVHIGIGTPNRLQALLENGSLKMSQLKYVILDWSWHGVKRRKMCDIPEIRSDLFSLLKKHLIPKAKSTNLKFGLL